MKKLAMFLLFAVFSVSVLADSVKYDSIVDWKMEGIDPVWIKSAKTTYSYENDIIVGHLVEHWQNDDWVNYERSTYLIDANYRETIEERWDGYSWVNHWRQTSTSNEFDGTTFYYDWNGSSWDTTSKLQHTESPDGLTKINKRYTLKNAQWQISSEYSYLYDTDGNNIGLTYIHYWNGLPAYKDISSYLSSGQTFEKPVQMDFYNFVDGQWKQQQKEIWVYDSKQNQIQYFYYNLNYSGELELYSKDSTWYEYYSNGNAKTSTTSTFDYVGQYWTDPITTTYSYNNNNQCILEQSPSKKIVREFPNEFSTIESTFDSYGILSSNHTVIKTNNDTYLVYSDKYYNSYDGWSGDSSYYYRGTLGITDTPVQIENVSVYPNPTTGPITITSDKQIDRVELYSLSGSVVLSEIVKTDSVKYDLSFLPKGLYLAKIYQGKSCQTKKIILN